jgi:hypothetical protein
LRYLYSQNEDRLRLGNKNKQAYFVLLSACAIFIPKMKTGCASAMKTNKFILHCSRLALSLQQKPSANVQVITEITE